MSWFVVLAVVLAVSLLAAVLFSLTAVLGLALRASKDAALQYRGWQFMIFGSVAAILAFVCAGSSATGLVVASRIDATTVPAPAPLQAGRTDIVTPIAPIPLPAPCLETAKNVPAPTDVHLGARYLLYAKAVHFEPRRDLRTTIYRDIQLFDESSINQFTTIEYTFNPVHQAVYVNYLRIRDEHGQVVAEGNVDDYYVLDSNDDLATEDRILKIPVPALKPGRRIELAITTRELEPDDQLGFMDFAFSSNFPVELSAFFFRGDTASRRWHDNGETVGVRIDRQKVDGGMLWTVRQPPIDIVEMLMDEADRYLPFVYIGDHDETWEAGARRYLAMIEHRCQIPSVTRELAHRVTTGITDRRERILAVARHVQREYQYQGLEFGEKALVMNDTARTVHNGYGDCKDLSLLACQLLQASGERAQLALVATQWPVIHEVPTVDQFDHMVVYLPNFDGGRFFDPTDRETDPRLPVPYGVGGRTALVLDPVNPRLVRIGDYPADSNRMEYDRQLLCQPNGDVQVAETVTFYGYCASDLRFELHSNAPSRHSSILQSWLEMGDGSPRLQRMEIENLDDATKPLVFHLKYIFEGLLHRHGGQLSGKVPLVWEAMDVSPEYASHRQTPFWIEYPVQIRGETTLRATEGMLRLAEVTPSTLSTDFFQCSIECETAADKTRIEHQLACPSGRYPAKQYADYYDQCRSARNLLTPRMTLDMESTTP